MLDKEQKKKKKTLKQIFRFFLIGGAITILITFVASRIYPDLFILMRRNDVFLFSVSACLFGLVHYYFVFVKEKISYQRSMIIFLLLFMCIITVLTYLAGGFGGPMTSFYFLFIIVSALLVEEDKAIYMTGAALVIYLMFVALETLNVITPGVSNILSMRHTKIVIDVVSFLLTSFLITIIAKNAKDSFRFYRLRSARLSKMRERLESLVKKRTSELRASNKRLRKAQTDLRKSYDELKKLDVKKNEFLSITSHELQTPLTTIRGFTQLLQKKKIFEKPKKREQYLRLIEEESVRLSTLVEDMLDLSRIDLGALKFNIETFELPQLLKDLKVQMGQRVKKRGLKLELKIAKELPKMETDKEKLRQILLNLINNAIKYTKKGSIKIGARKSGNSIEFSVADTGIGIPKKDRKKIFRRFSKIQPSKDNKNAGTGLGLSICKEYVNLMGGKIWLTSKVGKGTTFYFTLPIKFKPPRKIKKKR